jgi:hypothetical protein
MQAMYDYGNNTAQFLQNAMQAINTAKETKNWEEAKLHAEYHAKHWFKQRKNRRKHYTDRK